jgi:hypothetical protein
MSGRFDENGNLWIKVAAETVPAAFPKELQGLLDTSRRAREINLTGYIRLAKLPGWAQAALSSSTADITIVAGEGE